MKTVGEAQESIGEIQAQISETLDRIKRTPVPTAERSAKVTALRLRTNGLARRASEQVETLHAPQAEAVKRAAEAQQAAMRVHSELQSTRARLAIEEDVARRELQRRAHTSPEERPALQEAHSAAHTRLTDAQDKEHAANSQYHLANDALNRAGAAQTEALLRARAQEAPEALLALETAMLDVLNEAGALEREEAKGLARAVEDDTTQAFQKNVAEFESAEQFHKTHAARMLSALVVLVVLAATAVWFLFLQPTSPPPPPVSSATVLHRAPSAATPEVGRADAISAIEHAAHVAVGKIAVLFFLAWAFRFAAALHRNHVEQAIIYRDKIAALSVAEVIVKAATIEQKRDVLTKLAIEYLTFEDSAFVKKHLREDRADGIDVNIRRMKRLAGVLDPAFKAVGGIVNKDKR